jgi:hypothetical protein
VTLCSDDCCVVLWVGQLHFTLLSSSSKCPIPFLLPCFEKKTMRSAVDIDSDLLNECAYNYTKQENIHQPLAHTISNFISNSHSLFPSFEEGVGHANTARIEQLIVKCNSSNTSSTNLTRCETELFELLSEECKEINKYFNKSLQSKVDKLLDENLEFVLSHIPQRQVKLSIPFQSFQREDNSNNNAYQGTDCIHVIQSNRANVANQSGNPSLFPQSHSNDNSFYSNSLGIDISLPSGSSYITVGDNITIADDPYLHYIPYFTEADIIYNKTDIDVSLYNWDNDSDKKEINNIELDYLLLFITKQYGESSIILKFLSEHVEYSIPSVTKRLSQLNSTQSRRLLSQRAAGLSDSGPAGLSTENFSRLFCRRCFVFHCEKHGANHPKPRINLDLEKHIPHDDLLQDYANHNESSTKAKKAVSSNLGEYKETFHCEDCYLDNSAGPANSLGKTRSKFPGNSVITVPTDWSSEELLLLRRFYYITGPVPCYLAAMLGSKSCRAIYSYLSSQENQLLSFAQSSSAATPVLDEENHRIQRKRKRKQSNSARINRPTLIQKGLPSPFTACDHSGECGPNNPSCICAKNATFCERFCGCSSTGNNHSENTTHVSNSGPNNTSNSTTTAQNRCSLRFTGCSCRSGCSTRACPCFVAHRECEPGVCKPCCTDLPSISSKSVASSANSFNSRPSCRNQDLSYGCHSQLLLSRSLVHGWGSFARSNIPKNSLICEYLGERISQTEADRRGKIYDKLNRSYLFNLNSEFVIDAARKGNKIKFANHSSAANCYSRVMMCSSGDHRIGIFANRNISSGEELLFDYQHEQANDTNSPIWFQEQHKHTNNNYNINANHNAHSQYNELKASKKLGSYPTNT